MRVLVTGASGFIGHYVVEALLAKGLDVTTSARSYSSIAEKPWREQVQFVPHTLGEGGAAEDLFQKFLRPDVLIHLAWRGLPNYNQLFHFEDELPAQYHFLKTLVMQGLRNIAVAGTCFEYGIAEGCLDEEMAGAPANPYAIAKNTLRIFLEALQKHQQFQLKWLRLFYMYGRGQSQSSILSLIDTALERGEPVFNMSEGSQLRDYLPVTQMAGCIVDAALQSHTTGIINSCSGRPISVVNLVEQHLKQRGKTIQLNRGYYSLPAYEPKDFWGSTVKLSRVTDAFRL